MRRPLVTLFFVPLVAACLDLLAFAGDAPTPLRFETTAAADAALAAASGLDAQLALVRPLAVTYIRDGEFAILANKLNAAPAPAGTEWHRSILLCELFRITGDFDTAKKCIAMVPAASRADIVLLKYKQEHPEVCDIDLETLAAMIAKNSPSIEARLDNISLALDNYDTDAALALLSANPGDIAQSPLLLLPLARRLEREDLTALIVPEVEKLKDAQPDNIGLRFLLARLQLGLGEKKEAAENLWAVYEQNTPPAGSPAEKNRPSRPQTGLDYTQRVNVHEGLDFFETTDPWLDWRECRDLALVQLSKLAIEDHTTAAFLQRVPPILPGDDRPERLLAFIHMDSAVLAFGEIRSYLDSSDSSPPMDDLAVFWLGLMQDNDSAYIRVNSARLLTRLKQRVDDAKKKSEEIPFAVGDAAHPPDIGGPDNVPLFKKALEAASKTDDSALIARINAEIDRWAPIDADCALPRILIGEMRAHPGEAFYSGVVARSLALAARISRRSFVGAHALNPCAPWVNMHLMYDGVTPVQPAQNPTIASQAAEVLMIHANFSAHDGTDSESLGLWVRPYIPGLRPAEFDGLDQLAADSSSPLHDDALMAKAILLNADPARSDEAFQTMSGIVVKSPSDFARFWLTGMYAKRGLFPAALAQINAINPGPGYYTAFIQNARAVLNRATQGTPLPAAAQPFQNGSAWPNQVVIHPSAPPEPPARKNASGDPMAAFKDLVGQKNYTAAAKVLDRIFHIYPLGRKNGRFQFFKACNDAGLLPVAIDHIKAAVNASPTNVEAHVALAQAYEASDPRGSVPYYLDALKLAPDDTKLASEILGLWGSVGTGGRDVLPAFDVVFAHDPLRTLITESFKPLIANFKESIDLPPVMAALAAGDGPLGEWTGSDAVFLRSVVRVYHEAGRDKDLLDILPKLTHPSSWGSNDSSVDPVFESMISNGMGDAAFSVIQGLFLPPPVFHGVDTIPAEPRFNVASKPALNILNKARALKSLDPLIQSARDAVARDPDDSHAWGVLLTLLAASNAHATTAEFQPYLDFLGSDPKHRTNQDLATLAFNTPSTRDVGYAMQASSAPSADASNLSIDPLLRLVRSALDVGEKGNAATQLRRLLNIATTRVQDSKAIETAEWMNTLPLFLRAGMDDEARQMYKTILSAGVKQNPSEISPAMVLAYMRHALVFGYAPAAREAAPDFQSCLEQSLAAHNGNLGGMHVPVQMVLLYARLGLADSAARDALKTMAASGIVYKKDLDDATATLDRLTSDAPPAAPVVFLDGMKNGEMHLWWDFGTNISTRNGINFTLLGAVITPSGPYTIQVTYGQLRGQQKPFVTITNAAARGAWHGKVSCAPGDVHYLQVTVTKPGGTPVTGPEIPVCVTRNLLADPDFTDTVQAGKPTPAWSFRDGIFTSVPGPVPGDPGVNFIPSLASQAGTRDPLRIAGARIPVKPGQSFSQSGWLRREEGFYALEWGCRFLDADGKQLGDERVCAGARSGDNSRYFLGDGWIYVSARYVSGEKNARLQELINDPSTPDEVNAMWKEQFDKWVIPDGAAFIEPFISCPSDYHIIPAYSQWAGLSIGLIPDPAPLDPNPTPKPVPTPSRGSYGP